MIKRWCRLLKIIYVFTKYGLDQVFLPNSWIFAVIRLSVAHKQDAHEKRGIYIRQAFTELGPIFVKFGQLLSTRVDIIPEDIIVELAKLQDDVPPFASEQAVKQIEQAFKCSIDKIYANFTDTVLASASIAQVHAARLLTGEDVVVKVLRPDIAVIIKQDIELLLSIAKLLEFVWVQAKQFKVYAVIKEIEKHMLNELDLVKEAANASQLKRNFNDENMLYVPKIYWEHTKKTVMTMERIYGVPISNIETLRQNHIELHKLAKMGVEIFFTQVFRDCFFHADMHPGNIWIDVQAPYKPRYLALDFGIMGTLGPEDQYYLAENFLAFFHRNYRRVAKLHIDSGWVPSDTRIDELESAIRSVCEPIFERPLKEISFGKTLMQLFNTAQRFQMQVQPQLILLQKTLISVEGLGRQLYPDLDLWHTAKPFLEKWMRERSSIGNFALHVRDKVPGLLANLPEISEQLYHKLLANKVKISAINHNPQKTKLQLNSSLLFFLAGMLTVIIIKLI